MKIALITQTIRKSDGVTSTSAVARLVTNVAPNDIDSVEQVVKHFNENPDNEAKTLRITDLVETDDMLDVFADVSSDLVMVKLVNKFLSAAVSRAYNNALILGFEQGHEAAIQDMWRVHGHRGSLVSADQVTNDANMAS
ncbi:MAG: hypothetical protein WCV79_03855 [Candidatus Paceibacterota bacterium]|jgi:hypothetical protein